MSSLTPTEQSEVIIQASPMASHNPGAAALLTCLFLFFLFFSSSTVAYYEPIPLEPATEVIVRFQKAIKEIPGADTHAPFIARLIKEAQSLAEKACAKNSEDPAFQDTRGWIYWKQGMKESAKQAWETAISLVPDNQTIKSHLVLLEEKQNTDLRR